MITATGGRAALTLLVTAVIWGLLLDLLASGDRARVEAAAESFLAGLSQPG